MLAGMWLPANSVLWGVRGYVVFESSTIIPSRDVGMASLGVAVLPIHDPDGVGTMDQEWDTHVDKDSSALTLDMDEATADGKNFWEPGAQIWEETFEVGGETRMLMKQTFLSGFGHNSLAENRDPETPFGYEFIGGKRMDVRLKGGMRTDRPSLVAIAAGSPLTTITSATAAIAAMAEADWGQLQFIDHVLERAMLALLGVMEGGAETPWEEATALLKTHLDPAVFETSAGTFVPLTWDTYGQVTFDVSLEGRMPKDLIDLGR